MVLWGLYGENVFEVSDLPFEGEVLFIEVLQF
jgi:hypothetical protein